MASKRAVCIAVVSDLHTNSTLGLCPDERIRLDDSGYYKPSRAQAWLWANWLDYWRHVAVLRDRHQAELRCVFNGDLVEGLTHHGTTQVVSAHPEPQAYIAERVFSVPQQLKPDATFVVRGTEAHVGHSGASEEAFARSIHAEKDPQAKTWSWWHLRFAVHGVRFDMQHHGRMGQRPWTEVNVVANLAAQIFYEHARRGIPHPHLAFRSHFHKHKDTHDAHPTRVIQTPAFQLKTAHAHKVAPESIADVGGIIVVVTPDGQYEVTTKLYQPELPKMWVAT